MRLENKTIVITGGTSGIGRALVEQLSVCNRLIVIARPTERLTRLQTLYPQICCYGADLGWQQDIDYVGEQIMADHPKLDLIIHNAAMQQQPCFTDPDFSYDRLGEEITLNLTSIGCLTQRFLPCLLHGEESTILMVNSALAFTPKTQSAIYCATKAALDSLTRSLRYQLSDSNVAVLQAYLPLVDTAMTAGRGSGKLSPQEAAREILKGIEFEIADHAIGKARLLRGLMRLSPTLGRLIMRSA